MEHLTFEDYYKYGGRVDASLFPLLEIDATALVSKITNDRLEELTPTQKRMMVKIIDEVIKPREALRGITSYSNGFETTSYNAEEFTEEGCQRKAKKICAQFLDSAYLYRGIKNENNNPK